MGVVAEITNGLSVGAYVLALVTVGAVLYRDPHRDQGQEA